MLNLGMGQHYSVPLTEDDGKAPSLIAIKRDVIPVVSVFSNLSK